MKNFKEVIRKTKEKVISAREWVNDHCPNWLIFLMGAVGALGAATAMSMSFDGSGDSSSDSDDDIELKPEKDDKDFVAGTVTTDAGEEIAGSWFDTGEGRIFFEEVNE